MSKGMNGKRNYWFLVLAFLLLLPNFLPFHLFDLSAEKHKWESFEPGTAQRLRSVEAVLTYTDSLAAIHNVEPNSLEYGDLLTEVIKILFYHGYSHYSLKENWIAAMAGKIIWYDLSAIVLPDDIVKYPMAACSQQSIVFIECLRRKGISFRKVAFDHHFAVEANFNGWYFFDPDLEPDFTSVKRASLQNLLDENKLYDLYKDSMSPEEVNYYLANPYYGEPNRRPAENATFFHSVTKILSRTIWLLPIAIFLFFAFGRRSELFWKKERHNYVDSSLGNSVTQ
jgi:hypothetical protein